MPLARQQNDIPWLCHVHQHTDGGLAVGLVDTGTAISGEVAVDLTDNVHNRLVCGVVGGQDAEIGAIGRRLRQIPPPLAGAPAHRAEEADQTLRIISPQGVQHRGEADSVVGVVNDKGHSGQSGTRDRLEPTRHRSPCHQLPRAVRLHPEAPADHRQRRQSVLYVELSRKGQKPRPVYGFSLMAHRESHPKPVPDLGGADLRGIPMGTGGAGAEGLNRRGDPICHEGGGAVIGVGNQRLGGIVGEQELFAVPIMLHGGMLHPADVVAGEVEEQDAVKDQPADASHPQSLGGHLQSADLHPRVQHSPQMAVDLHALGGGIDGIEMVASVVHAVGADVARGNPCGGQKILNQQGCGGLALGAGETDEPHFPFGMAVKLGGAIRHGGAGVGDYQYHSVRGQVKLLLRHEEATALAVC